MPDTLKGRTIAILATDGFEQVELTGPMQALRDAGATVHVVSPKAGSIQGWKHLDKGETVVVDVQLADADAGRYSALMLPGGVINPDQLRLQPKAIAFIQRFVQTGKPIAAICHGPWLLIDAEGVAGKRLTSWPSLRADLSNAGAYWVDEEVVTDRGLVTSRKPDDLPAFNRAMIAEFCGAQPAARSPQGSTAARTETRSGPLMDR